MFLNQTSAGAEDWNFGFSPTYKNMARSMVCRIECSDFARKQYGDQAPGRSSTRENARVGNRYLIRDITVR